MSDNDRLIRTVGLIVTLALLAVIVFGFIAVRKGRSRAATAREFVEKYSDAFQRKSAGDVIKMTADPKLHMLDGLPDDLKKTLLTYKAEKELQYLKKQFKEEDMFYRAWCMTSFHEERPHGDHIHVTVDIQGAKADIILVREEGYLKIHPFPSIFDLEETDSSREPQKRKESTESPEPQREETTDEPDSRSGEEE